MAGMGLLGRQEGGLSVAGQDRLGVVAVPLKSGIVVFPRWEGGGGVIGLGTLP